MKKMIFGAILIMMMTMITTGCKASNPDKEDIYQTELIGSYDATIMVTTFTAGTETTSKAAELWTFDGDLITIDLITHTSEVHAWRWQGSDQIVIDTTSFNLIDAGPPNKAISLYRWEGHSTEGRVTNIGLVQKE